MLINIYFFSKNRLSPSVVAAGIMASTSALSTAISTPIYRHRTHCQRQLGGSSAEYRQQHQRVRQDPSAAVPDDEDEDDYLGECDCNCAQEDYDLLYNGRGSQGTLSNEEKY